MKPFLIDLEKVEGMLDNGTYLEVQGAMTVREEPEPLEGVHQSRLVMSRASAAVLMRWLQQALAPR